MAEAGHKYIKDLVLKAFFKLYFHFHVVWIFKKFQFDFRFDFKLSGRDGPYESNYQYPGQEGP